MDPIDDREHPKTFEPMQASGDGSAQVAR